MTVLEKMNQVIPNYKYLSDKVKKALIDLELNDNLSLYDEVLKRNKNNMTATALFYRGTKITYKQLFDRIEEYASAMTSAGIKAGDEIPICMANTPELVYVLLAASYVGAKVNIFGNEFNKDYIKSIINKCKSNLIFVSDNLFEEIKDITKTIEDKKVILTSLATTKNNDSTFTNISSFYKDDNVITIEEFLTSINTCAVHHDGKLDDVFSTTYSSGSTNAECPKGIVHANRSYITMGRFHDVDLSKAPSMHNLVVLAQIPTHSNTNIMSNISDTLLQGSTIALEPIYDKDFFLESLIINKPSFCTATRSFILTAAKKIMNDPKYEGVKLPDLLALFSVGEATSKSEEKYINKALKKAKAGTKKLPIPTTLCIAGGDCEHGGIFYTMFKAWRDKLPTSLWSNNGMSHHQMVSCVVVDENGKILPPNTKGKLFSTSPCNMLEYRDNPDATDNFFKEFDGVKYGDCSVYATMDQTGKVLIEGRIDEKLPSEVQKMSNYINEIIQDDTKTILSSEVIPVLNNDDYNYVIHVEKMPGISCSYNKLISSIAGRIENKIEHKILDDVSFQIHKDGFPLTGCGKRDFNLLKTMGLGYRYLQKNEIQESNKQFIK